MDVVRFRPANSCTLAAIRGLAGLCPRFEDGANRPIHQLMSATRPIGLASGADRASVIELGAGTLASDERGEAQVFINAAVAGWNIGAGVGLLLFGGLVLFHTMISPTVPFATKALIVALSLPLPLFLLLRAARAGVVCDRAGVTIRNPCRHVRLRWEEIDQFAQAQGTFFTSPAWAHRTDGSSIHIYGIARSTSRTAEREAQSIIDALNRRLAVEHSER